jgi:heterotetrameric sarcosine oxidase gamma subunit
MDPGQSPVKLTPINDASRELGVQFVEIAGWQVPQVFNKIEDEIAASGRNVTLADGSASGKLVVEGKSAEAFLQTIWSTPPLAIGQGEKIDSKHVYRIRDDVFFIHLNPGEEDAAAKTLSEAVEKSGDLITVTDITHGRADLLLVGPRSTQLLSRLCSLDFHPSHFPDLWAKQSSVAKTRQLILRHDIKPRDGAPILAFSLIGARSLAAYLWATIREAGHDLDLAPIGQSALEKLRVGI